MALSKRLMISNNLFIFIVQQKFSQWTYYTKYAYILYK